MGSSIFANFDPDKMHDKFNVRTSFGYAPNLYLVIVQALTSCGKWDVHEGFKSRRDLTNDEFHVLSEKINELAQAGFENQSEIPWLQYDDKPIEFDEYSVLDWALGGKEFKDDSDVTLAQINAFAALQVIDSAMTVATHKGITIDLVESLSMAAYFLSEARDADAHDLAKYWRTAAQLDMENQFREMKSKDAARRAAIRHANDPKQKEKAFVYECWTDWQTKPDQYKGKAEFARSMLEKCEHLTSQKRMEDWCRDWEAKQK